MCLFSAGCCPSCLPPAPSVIVWNGTAIELDGTTDQCACDSAECATSNSASYQDPFILSTGICSAGTLPYVSSAVFAATDDTSKFRIYTIADSTFSTGIDFYPLGSSMQLTQLPVNCSRDEFVSTSMLIANASELSVVLYCDASAGCNFQYEVDMGCTTATSDDATASSVTMDSCLMGCGARGYCEDGACTCQTGYMGSQCEENCKSTRKRSHTSVGYR